MATLLAAALAATLHVSQPQLFLLTLAKDIHGPLPPRLVLVDRSGKPVRTIGTPGYVLVKGEWSPNGRSIAWSDPAGVHVEDADGTNARVLVAHVPGCDTSCTQPVFVWEPDGTALDVGGVGKQTNELLHVPVDGAPPSPWIPAKPWSNPLPIGWTPGGRSFVWSGGDGHVGSRGCCFVAIYETTPATHTTKVVYRSEQTQGQGVALSPDATRWVEFVEAANPMDDYGLTLVDAKTGKTRVLLAAGATSSAVWSPNGKTIATVLADGRVLEIALATGRARRIGSGEQLFYGRDGTLYVTRDRYSQVWTSTNGSPERFLFRTPGGLEVYDLEAG